MKTPKYGWPAALIFLGGMLVTELLPIVGGTGTDARFDWSFTSVTLHFVLLPLAAGIHIVWNLGALVVSRAQAFRGRLIVASSVIISLAYLSLLGQLPLFSLLV